MFRSQHHVGGSKEGIWASCKDRDSLFFRSVRSEMDFRALGTADPVALHFLKRMTPINDIEIFDQTIGISCDSEHPLAHGFTNDGESADFAFAVHDFFIGQNRSQFGTPVDRRFRDVCQTLAVTIGALFLFRFQLRRISKCCNWFSLLSLRIEPGIIDFQEDPLCPLEVMWISSVDLSFPVITESQRFDLSAEVIDVCFCGDAGMLTCFDRVLLSGETKSIPSHGVEDIITFGPMVTSQDICGCISFRMTDM